MLVIIIGAWGVSCDALYYRSSSFPSAITATLSSSFSRNSSNTDWWNSSRGVPCRSRNGRADRSEGSRIPFSDCKKRGNQFKRGRQVCSQKHTSVFSKLPAFDMVSLLTGTGHNTLFTTEWLKPVENLLTPVFSGLPLCVTMPALVTTATANSSHDKTLTYEGGLVLMRVLNLVLLTSHDKHRLSHTFVWTSFASREFTFPCIDGFKIRQVFLVLIFIFITRFVCLRCLCF